ncbi:MFS transporter [Kitasatospora sp. NBC_01287]|uniref:MFS transporter n=1 Tax=Kitasatospora sp. NBC_01287 TaxID=2903573 RepID=UPI00224D25A7|nr:MFS transporter [Kitasatospora sp. NBC_01287]MCX4746447.1 MFS transporter [Kitasatospora sp. NBC_01287]
MLSSYRQIFDAPGSLAFSATGFVSRLPISMTGVGIITMLSQLRGSYGVAGAVSAVMALSAAAIGPQISRLVDRHGQRRIAVPCTAVTTASTVALLLCARSGAPDWTLFVCAIGMGTMVSTGALVRARWAHLYRRDTTKLHTAYALESVVDEIIFIVGPILSIGLATSLFPEAGVLLAAVFLALGVLLFTAQRGTEPPVHERGHEAPGSAIRSPGLRVLMLTFIATGAIFGSVEVVTVGFAQAQGHKAAASLVLAVYALGSAVAGTVFGALRPRGTAERRFQTGVGVMAVTMVPLVLAALWCTGPVGLVAVGAALFVSGLSIAPTMITTMGLVERLVPPAQLTEGMSWTTTGLALGVAGGSWAAGVLVDAAGAAAGYRVPLLAAVFALLVALIGGRWLRPASGADAPEPVSAAH